MTHWRSAFVSYLIFCLLSVYLLLSPSIDAETGFSAFSLTIILVALSIAQSVFILFFDLLFLSNPLWILTINATAKTQIELEQLKSAKAKYVLMACDLCRILAMISGAYGFILAASTYKFGPKNYFAMIPLVLGLAGLIYIHLRIRTSWAKLYLG